MANPDQLFEVFDSRRHLELISTAYDKQQIELSNTKSGLNLFNSFYAKKDGVSMKNILNEFEILKKEATKDS